MVLCIILGILTILQVMKMLTELSPFAGMEPSNILVYDESDY